MLGYRVEKAQSMMGLACEMDNLALKSTRDSLWNRENTRRCFVDANNEYVVSFIFLPLALTIYYISNNTAKEYVLLGASLVFYASRIRSVYNTICYSYSYYCFYRQIFR